jgi:protein-disulfide isomerase
MSVQPIPSNSDSIILPRWVAIAFITGLIMFVPGGILGYQMAANQFAREQAASTPQIDAPGVDDDPFLGSINAPVTIIEFGDYRCTYCKYFHREIFTALIKEYDRKIRFVYRDFPVLGGQSEAEASQCANDQHTFWVYHDALFSSEQTYTSVDQLVTLAGDLQMDTSIFRACLEGGKYRNEVQADYQDGRKYGITGTPTFFINGIRLIGAQPLSVFESVIDQQLVAADL